MLKEFIMDWYKLKVEQAKSLEEINSINIELSGLLSELDNQKSPLITILVREIKSANDIAKQLSKELKQEKIVNKNLESEISDLKYQLNLANLKRDNITNPFSPSYPISPNIIWDSLSLR